ncbi:MAG: glutathione peroxidase [Bacteroidales bacterium]
MKSIIITLTTVIMATSALAQTDFYSLSAKDINGEEVNFSDFNGKKLLIVNTASKCGFTEQYEGLQKLHEEFGGEDFMIIGFPSNDFMNQEPGTEEEIKAFCKKNYGVSFLMMSKIKVKGKDKHKVYEWLTSKKHNGVKDSKVKWNFQKYMVSKEGQLVGVVGTKSKPYSEEILNFIKS